MEVRVINVMQRAQYNGLEGVMCVPTKSSCASNAVLGRAGVGRAGWGCDGTST